MLVVASKVKAFVKAQEMRVSKEVLDHLSKMIEQTLMEASARARQGKRKTVQVEDLT